METKKSRTERDSFGEIEVSAENLWGAQTQRSLHHFSISTERMDSRLIHALVTVKKAAADINAKMGALALDKAFAINSACDEILRGLHPEQFPLSVWQTGSGTQTNMNVNEVIANIASELMGGERGEGRIVHPNDDVNKSQSSNDVFPTAMSISATQGLVLDLLPEVEKLKQTLKQKSHDFMGVTKIGRTHLMDATPLTLGQEISGWVCQLDQSLKHVEATIPHLSELALGGTAVGTGLNAPQGFSSQVTEKISLFTGISFTSAPNKFEALSSSDNIVQAHGALKGLAASLMKIANDVRWLASGPRCGIGEISIPENEPGSSIMPGKVNPTQCEALTMVCAQVMGNDVAISIGGASGSFQLNVYRPMMTHNFLMSVRILSDACRSFDKFCAQGIQPNLPRVKSHLENSLMLVTALNPHIGYDKAAEIAKKAHRENTTLKEAAVTLGYLTGEQFQEWVDPAKMTNVSTNQGTC